MWPIPNPSIFCHKYFLTVMDNYSRFCWIFLMKLKFETIFLIKSFVSRFKAQFNETIKFISYDNGPEFTLIFFYMITTYTIRPNILILLNIMDWLKNNINTSWMLLVLFSFNQSFPIFFGAMLFLMQFTSLVDYLQNFYFLNLVFILFITWDQIIQLWKCLVALFLLAVPKDL